MKYIQYRKQDTDLMEHPILLLTGEETYFREDILSSYRDIEDVQIQKISERSFDESGILNRLHTRNLEGNRQVIWIQQASKSFLTQHEDWIRKCVEQPGKHNVLVLEVPDASFQANIVKYLKKNVLHIDCSPPDDNQLRRWIRSFFSRQDLKIQQDAVEELIKRVGQQLKPLRQEMEKMALYATDEQFVTKEHVRTCVIRQEEMDFFDFVDSWLEGDSEPVLQEVRRSLRQGEDETKIAGGLLWALRRLRFILEMHQKGKNVPEIQKHVNIPTGILRQYIHRFGDVDPVKLQRAAESFFVKDHLTRTGEMDSERGLEFLVLRGFSAFDM